MLKRALIEISQDTKYYEFIEAHRKERGWSYTACIKNLLFERIDDLMLLEQGIITNNIPQSIDQVPPEEEPEKKKNMLKNLHRLKE